MIFVKRTPKPKILQKNEIAWKQAIRQSSTLEELNSAIAKYKHKTVKEALNKMFNGKCAFCESYLLNVDYGDIEHYKPKSKFPELAVSWDNLLLSCKKCNGSGQKGDQWPNKKMGGPLLNPCKDKPEDFFQFIYDQLTGVTIVKPKNKRGVTSELIYGLNKHELLKDRNLFVKKLIVIAQLYHTDTRARQLIDDATKSDQEYSAFAKMVKLKYVKKNK